MSGGGAVTLAAVTLAGYNSLDPGRRAAGRHLWSPLFACIGRTCRLAARSVAAMTMYYGSTAPVVVAMTMEPANAQAQAQSMVGLYLAVFQRAGVPMKPGASHAAGTQGVLPAPAGHFRFYSPVPGVIIYRYQHGAFAPPVSMEEPSESPMPSPGAPSFWRTMEIATGLTGAALVLYLIISETSRVVLPPRNFIPVP